MEGGRCALRRLDVAVAARGVALERERGRRHTVRRVRGLGASRSAAAGQQARGDAATHAAVRVRARRHSRVPHLLAAADPTPRLSSALPVPALVSGADDPPHRPRRGEPHTHLGLNSGVEVRTWPCLDVGLHDIDSALSGCKVSFPNPSSTTSHTGCTHTRILCARFIHTTARCARRGHVGHGKVPCSRWCALAAPILHQSGKACMRVSWRDGSNKLRVKQGVGLLMKKG